MATIQYFDTYKVFNTTRNEYVVYLLSGYRTVGGQCVPNPLNVTRQCMYSQGPEPIWVDTLPDTYNIPSTPNPALGPLPPQCPAGGTGP